MVGLTVLYGQPADRAACDRYYWEVHVLLAPPSSELDEPASRHPAPRPRDSCEILAGESACSRRVCLQPHGPYLPFATVDLSSPPSVPQSPVPRQPPFRVGFSACAARSSG